MDQEHNAEQKKPISEDNIMDDSIYLTLLKHQNYSDREQISGCQGLRLGKSGNYIRVTHGSFFIVMEQL